MRRRILSVLGALGLAVALSGCTPSPEPTASPERPLQLWTHGGTDAELATLQATVRKWERDTGRTVRVKHIAEGDYPTQLQAAAAGDTLPDVIDIDGPAVDNLAYRGQLAALDSLLPADLVSDLLPSLRTQGSYRGHLYAAGAFDSGLGIFADRARLRQIGARIPTGVDDAWTATEFAEVLRTLAATDPDGKVLDLKLSYGAGEWYTYAFAPLLSSAGGAVLDPATGQASGTLDSTASISAMTTLQSWRRYLPADDEKAFVQRDVALSWVGHWQYADYRAALGQDLVLLPLPDLGRGSRSGMGSWAWGISTRSTQQQAAADLLQRLLSPAAITSTTAANGAVPGRVSVLADDPDYQPGGPLTLYAQQLSRACATATSTNCVTVPRPVTPGYPLVTTSFALAVSQIMDPAAPLDPAEALTTAAAAIDADTAANDGYRSPAN